MINLAVMNQSTAVTDAGVQSLLPSLTTQWNRDLAATWNVDQVAMTFVPAGSAPAPGQWWMVFVDDATQAGALALHDLTDEGLPVAKIFSKLILTDKERIDVAASHELLEMAVDPTLAFAAQDPNGRFWALEIADPCEDDQYAYDIAGVQVSDFVTRNWFQPKTDAGTLFSFKGNATAAYQILSGGYAQWFDPKHGWQQETNMKKVGHTPQRTLHAPHGSRREKRMRKYSGLLRRSNPVWSHP
jgi:hypothetical protein